MRKPFRRTLAIVAAVCIVLIPQGHKFRLSRQAAQLSFISLAHAEAPKVQTQVPGYYRIELGRFEITALFDGALELETSLLKNISAADLQELLARKFVGNPKMQTAVNAYLVNTGSNLVLVDVGAAKLFGPSLGFVLENMKAAGYDPAQVDTVVITHLHGDHVGGLNDAGGRALFPKAKILVAKADNDFWLSQEIADGSPVELQPFFKIARDSAAPYLASGQWQTFTEGDTLVSGIHAVKADGHTPGHTAFAVESEGQKLLIWGDLVHAHAVQFARPGVSIEFDIDQEKAIATRHSIMKAMATGDSLVAGMHLPFPGIGHVLADGENTYSWVPVEYSPLPGPANQ
jgi:glyoxylase-like metal-dependent hydrolase (beta-lactamase superfamily II)